MSKLSTDNAWSILSNGIHDMRSPIGNVLGFSELLLASDPPETTREMLERICWNTQRLEKIVESISDLARAQSSETVLPLEIVPLDSQVTEALDRLQDDMTLKQVEVSAELGSSSNVEGTATDLVTLFENIIGNAIKYSPPQSKIWVGTARNASYVDIKVTDEGPGIVAEDLDLVWAPFYRTESARLSDGIGSGLGLSICKQIVENHRGTIDISSTVGHGTTVSVSLPVHYDDVVHLSVECPVQQQCDAGEVTDCDRLSSSVACFTTSYESDGLRSQDVDRRSRSNDAIPDGV